MLFSYSNTTDLQCSNYSSFTVILTAHCDKFIHKFFIAPVEEGAVSASAVGGQYGDLKCRQELGHSSTGQIDKFEKVKELGCSMNSVQLRMLY